MPVLCGIDSLRAKRIIGDSPHASDRITAGRDSTRVVVVVPRSSFESTGWKPGGGDYCFELMASAAERYGDNVAKIFVVDDCSPHEKWQTALINHLLDVKATHCVAFAESDPARPGPWHWNDFAARARDAWDGTFVGVLTDGAYLLHQVRATRFRHAYPRSIFVAIDVSAEALARYVPLNTIYGPSFLPISRSSVKALDTESSAFDGQREFDIVFVGKVYPNREPLLEALGASGLRVGINPHRVDQTDRPDFASYVKGIRQGHFTVNLSEAGGMPISQLKSRMLEGPLFGTIVCTDEKLLARHFFGSDEFVFFNSAESLCTEVVTLLKDQCRLTQMRNAAHARATILAGTAFWTSVESGIMANDLNTLRPQL